MGGSQRRRAETSSLPAVARGEQRQELGRRKLTVKIADRVWNVTVTETVPDSQDCVILTRVRTEPTSTGLPKVPVNSLGGHGEREEISGAAQVRGGSTRRWATGGCPPESIADADGGSAGGRHDGGGLSHRRRFPRSGAVRLDGRFRAKASRETGRVRVTQGSGWRGLRDRSGNTHGKACIGVGRWALDPRGCPTLVVPGPDRAAMGHAEQGLRTRQSRAIPAPPHGWGNQWGRTRGPTLPGFARQRA